MRQFTTTGHGPLLVVLVLVHHERDQGKQASTPACTKQPTNHCHNLMPLTRKVLTRPAPPSGIDFSIQVVNNPDEATLAAMGVKSWPTWGCKYTEVLGWLCVRSPHAFTSRRAAGQRLIESRNHTHNHLRPRTYTRPPSQIQNSGEASTFPWTYGESETCYILQGKVTVTPNGGAPVTVRVACYAMLCCAAVCDGLCVGLAAAGTLPCFAGHAHAHKVLWFLGERSYDHNGRRLATHANTYTYV